MNIALLLSGGTGIRLGTDIPKQYLQAGGKPIIAYSLGVLFSHSRIDGVWIVADRRWRDFIMEHIRKLDAGQRFRGFSNPGETRQLSILNGLEDIWKYTAENNHVAEKAPGTEEADGIEKASGIENDYVLIHDAARPNLSGKLIEESFDAVTGHDGVLPVLPMKDTVYRSKDGRRIDELLNRSEIFAGQAPEIFILGKYLEANRRLLPDEIKRINGSTEPAILAGMGMVTISGDENNFKITTRADLERFRNESMDIKTGQ